MQSQEQRTWTLGAGQGLSRPTECLCANRKGLLLPTHTAPRLRGLASKAMAGLQPPGGGACARHNPTPIRDGSGSRTVLGKARKTKSPSTVPQSRQLL